MAWLLRDSRSTTPHAEHRWLVNAGSTRSTLPGASRTNPCAGQSHGPGAWRVPSWPCCDGRSHGHGERDMPAACPVAGDAERLHALRDEAGPPESYPADLRDADLPPVAAHAAHVTGQAMRSPPWPRLADGSVPPASVPARVPRATTTPARHTGSTRTGHARSATAVCPADDAETAVASPPLADTTPGWQQDVVDWKRDVLAWERECLDQLHWRADQPTAGTEPPSPSHTGDWRRPPDTPPPGESFNPDDSPPPGEDTT